MIPPFLSRQDLENLWRLRLNDAKIRLDFARTYVKEVQADLQSGTVPEPDGSFGFQKALRAENFALADYGRVLGIFTDLVVRGKVPDANDWLREMRSPMTSKS